MNANFQDKYLYCEVNALLTREGRFLAQIWRSKRLCQNLYFLKEELRGEISTIRPNDHMELFINRKYFKIANILQGLEYFSIKFRTNIYFTLRTIRKTEIKNIIFRICCVDHFWYYAITPMGLFCLKVFLLLQGLQLRRSSSLCRSSHSWTRLRARLGNLPLMTPDSISTVISYSPYIA